MVIALWLETGGALHCSVADFSAVLAAFWLGALRSRLQRNFLKFAQLRNFPMPEVSELFAIV